MSNNDGRILYLTLLHFSISFSFYRGHLQFYMYFVFTKLDGGTRDVCLNNLQQINVYRGVQCSRYSLILVIFRGPLTYSIDGKVTK